MSPLILDVGSRFDIGVAERNHDLGVFIGHHSESVQISWEAAIKLRDWLQLAIAERTERLHRITDPPRPRSRSDFRLP